MPDILSKTQLPGLASWGWLPRPTRSDWVFALRTLSAGYLAFLIALALGLQHPQWAMVTVFVVAQPVAGMVLAKGAFRMLGTAIGAVASIAMVLTLGAHPLPFILVLSLWIGLCTFVASTLRNPEAYGAALSGYTATIIGLPVLGSPHLVLGLAQARFVEITLGIVCAGLTSRLILPQLASEAMALRLRRCIIDLAAHARDTFSAADQHTLDASYRKLIAETQALSDMRTYVRLETPSRPRASSVRRSIGCLLWSLSAVRMIHRHAAPGNHLLAPIRKELTAILSGIAADPKALDDVAALTARLDAVAERVRAARGQVEETADRVQTVSRLMLAGEVAQAFRELLRGYAALVSPGPAAPERAQPTLVIHRDRRIALRNAVRAALATMLVATIWRVSGQGELAGGVILVAVGTSLFPSAPNPMMSIRGFLVGSLAAMPFAFVVGQLILPQLPGLGWIPLLTAPVLLPLALTMPNPQRTGIATAFAIGFLVFVNPSPAMAYDPAAFLAAAGSAAVGLFAALGVFYLVLPPDPQARLGALARAMRETLLRLCLHERLPSRSAFESLAYDRINAMIAPAQEVGKAGWPVVAGAVASVTVGLEILRLRRLLPAVSPALAEAIGASLRSLAREALLSQGGRSLSEAVAGLQAVAAAAAGMPEREALEVAASLRIVVAAIGDHPVFYRPGTGAT